eukprot:1848359-Pyramimonas_sp.AAC.1
MHPDVIAVRQPQPCWKDSLRYDLPHAIAMICVLESNDGLLLVAGALLIGGPLWGCSHPELVHGPDWRKKMEISRMKLSSR